METTNETRDPFAEAYAECFRELVVALAQQASFRRRHARTDWPVFQMPEERS